MGDQMSEQERSRRETQKQARMIDLAESLMLKENIHKLDELDLEAYALAEEVRIPPFFCNEAFLPCVPLDFSPTGGRSKQDPYEDGDDQR